MINGTLDLINQVVIPSITSLGDLLSRLGSGIVSLTVAKAELRSIFIVAGSRLDAAEAEDHKRDAAEDERVRELQNKAKAVMAGALLDKSDEPTK